ncbi:hypothetical protein [Pseudoduganella rhizocola]|uniref:hypothetical protein n=1 Tax=Pseudoduganella rhizocola TaxID=3382643 RepID=UPI0038B50236
MDSPVAAISYLARAKELASTGDKAKLIYAALELRCGVEARLKEHAAVAIGVTKSQANQWEIKKLSKTIDAAFGLEDTFLLIRLHLEDGRACQFMYAPVNSRLQEIAMRFGDYLHTVSHERVQDTSFWSELKSMLKEGCSLLELACTSELLRPTMEQGLHFALHRDDPRVAIVQDFQSGIAGSFSGFKFTPTGSFTIYLPEPDQG